MRAAWRGGEAGERGRCERLGGGSEAGVRGTSTAGAARRARGRCGRRPMQAEVTVRAGMGKLQGHVCRSRAGPARPDSHPACHRAVLASAAAACRAVPLSPAVARGCRHSTARLPIRI